MAQAFQRLFQTYPSFQADDDDDAVRVYFQAVDEYETQDIEAAVDSFLAGKAPGHNPSFVPPAPLVGAETRRLMNLRLDTEHRKRMAQPQLPPPDVEKTDASRARVAALTAKIVAEMAEKSLTPDAKAAQVRHAEMVRKTNERFAPDMSLEAQRQRLVPRAWGYDVGDEEVA